MIAKHAFENPHMHPICMSMYVISTELKAMRKINNQLDESGKESERERRQRLGFREKACCFVMTSRNGIKYLTFKSLFQDDIDP